ncbi:AAA family ATPase [Streptomyces gobiensis]|uniref:AAA family ATPase n=1 Tax=Streptomyces gobiensis TaxID=2875706 RepID=UPI001E652EAB|nr:SMC family ATPase [Streptomyces gobiensis]UGY94847.1 SMC family ATPase [Streptomyces gobiensis]
MRLHRLTLTAFGPFGDTQHIDFDALSTAGLFLLHGATGAGKTSVLDAVCYALYGGVPGARQSQGQSRLRSDHAAAGTPTEVILDLTLGERRLEITRRPEQPRPKRRGSGFTTGKAQSWLREYDPATGQWRALSRSHQEIGEEIGQLLGMSRDQFCQVVLLPQGDFARFLRAGAEERGQLLGRLFDTRRFAAVERHLTELRGTAQQRVRAADERLLTLAHRMQQAADSGDGVGNHPLPELVPGDPGLADAVLEWAAIARTDARERRAITAHAAHAAEAAHRMAQQRLTDARDLARLQRRHADARQRAKALAARSGERAQARAHLERARAADTVAPALRIREAAATEHREAAAAEQHARHRLPAHLAQAPGEQLAARERETRQELGSLAAARRAEQRSAAITAELAALEREAGADDDLLREAEDWLAGWSTLREAHQQRVNRAQEAATRAEQLAGQLAPARHRLDAARRRDRLHSEVRTAEDTLLHARERSASAHEHWLDLKDRRLRGIAAELAAALRDGEPCAVCGSTEHPDPDPGRTGEGHIDRQTEEAALTAYQLAEERRERAENTLRSLREALTLSAAEAGEAPISELAATAEALETEHTTARQTAADAHAARETLERAEREHTERLAAQRDAGRRSAARTSQRETLLREQTALDREISQAKGGAVTVAEQAATLERLAGALADAAGAAARVETTALRLKEADAQLANAAYRAGFDTPRAAADAALTADRQRELQRRLDDWQAEERTLAAEFADPELQAAAGQPPADPDAARQQADQATRRQRSADAADAAARARCADLDRLSIQAEADARGLAPLRREHDGIARLAGLAAGTSAENERKMRLESYVLAARLEQVAAAASVRLQQMSAGRYTLVHSDERASRGARSGLGLHVVDAWTGHERDTATLSGGETFFASLALALGLADVVSDEAGGMRLDTLFIDEGFGSLDEQTLDEVLEVLDSLRDRDRSVGIVSHVADLRLRVPAQLEVVKRRSGSAVRQRGSG